MVINLHTDGVIMQPVLEDSQVVVNFARQIYRDVEAYVLEHQAEFDEWLKEQNAAGQAQALPNQDPS
jgi:hypothetical protein